MRSNAAKNMLSAYTFWPQPCPTTVGRWVNNQTTFYFSPPRVFLAENVCTLVKREFHHSGTSFHGVAFAVLCLA
jgi:hypothetical protein